MTGSCTLQPTPVYNCSHDYLLVSDLEPRIRAKVWPQKPYTTNSLSLGNCCIWSYRETGTGGESHQLSGRLFDCRKTRSRRHGVASLNNLIITTHMKQHELQDARHAAQEAFGPIQIAEGAWAHVKEEDLSRNDNYIKKLIAQSADTKNQTLFNGAYAKQREYQLWYIKKQLEMGPVRYVWAQAISYIRDKWLEIIIATTVIVLVGLTLINK